MPYPAVGFPIPPFQWPHVGRQWPSYNVESDQADGLVAWWPTLAGRGANILQDLIGSNNGTLQGATWASSRERGHVSEFDGANAKIAIPSNPAIEGFSALTLSLWFYARANGQSGGSRLMSKSNGATGDNYGLLMYAANTPTLRITTAGGLTDKATTTVISLNQWYHLAGTWDGSQNIMRIYLNGIFENSGGTQAGALLDSNDNLTFGEHDDGPANRRFDGFLSDMRIYNRAPSDTEVWQLHAEPWELYQLPRRLWRLGVVAPPPAGQPIQLRALHIPHMRQWHPRIAS